MKITTNINGCEISTFGIDVRQHLAAVSLIYYNDPFECSIINLKEVDNEMVNVWIADAHSEGEEEYAEFLRDALAKGKDIYTLTESCGEFNQPIGEVTILGELNY